MFAVLFNFKVAYVYSFAWGMLIALAGNLATTALLTEDTPITHGAIYSMSLSLFVSSVAACIIGLLLENARREWEQEGSQRDDTVVLTYYRPRLMWLLFGIFLSGLAFALVVFITSRSA